MRKAKFFNQFYKKFVAGMVTASMLAAFAVPGTIANAAVTTEKDMVRSERLTQPISSHKFETNELAVVNFQPTWGDKDANIASMKEYIEAAHEKGVKILLFPEMCVTGYVSSSNPEAEDYKWAVSSAETLDGLTAKTFGKIADDNDMWIVYGATEVIEGDDQHAYNSAFACSPEGDVTSYQKIHPVEGSWCTAGETPVLLDAGDYGKIGISICYDTYATPELGRYYAAQGCNLLLNPTATSRGYKSDDDSAWEWYYKNRIESNASREGFTILSADLVGKDGLNDKYTFPGGSVILNGSAAYYGGTVDANGKGNTKADIITGEEGLVTNVVACTARSSGACSNQDFNPELYTTLYKELADKKAAGETLRYSNSSKDQPRAAVVNMTGYWGNKEKTLDKMEEYIDEAGEQGVDILVFPETVLSGYGYITPDKDPFVHKYGVSMQVATAETVPGPSTNRLSEKAKEYGMYIIFGMTQKEKKYKMYEQTTGRVLNEETGEYENKDRGKVEKVYNAAAILYPDGTIDSYQKIHRAGVEDQWSVCGTTPKMFDTPWGKVGIDICRDGHFYPELGRYYAAMGCTLFLHPTATTGNAWYRESRIGSYTDRDGMNAITCNLLGGDGIYNASGTFDPTDDEANFDEDGNFIGGDEIPDETPAYDTENPYWQPASWMSSGGIFNSTSLIITKARINVSLNGTGSESDTYKENGLTSPIGLEIADMDMSRTGFGITGFNPGLFSKMYDKLSQLYRKDYKSIYDEDAVAAPVTMNYKDMKDKAEEPTSEEPKKDPTTATPATTTKAPATTAKAPTTQAKPTTTTEAKTDNKVAPSVAKTKVKSAKFNGKKLSVKIKKIAGVSGYEIKVANNKSMKKAKVFTTKTTSNSILKKKLPTLKAKKKFYVKVRAFITDGTDTYYGAWSSKVKAK